tara:strand:- start:480 stop:1223 length:744 start_codon:yes stop_codon:yes gene_type:complete
MKATLAETRNQIVDTNQICLVIDVLRATSVMAVLLSFGVTKIYLSDSFAAARALKKELGPDIDLLLIGEKDAVPPDDFDGGNSPLDFLERGRKSQLPSTVIMVTTNGTPTLLACKNAPLTIPIAPLNLEASLKKATAEKRDILIVCSGFEGESAEDDLIAAGLIAERLVPLGFSLSNELNEIRQKYQAYYDSPVSLSTALRNTKHGQRLVVAEFDDDIDYCSNENVFDETGTLAWDDNNPLIKRSEK